MADHVPGSSDITQSQETFDRFMTFVTRTVIGLVIFMVFLAIFAR